MTVYGFSKVGNLRGPLLARGLRRAVHITHEKFCLSQGAESLSEKKVIFNSKGTYVKFPQNTYFLASTVSVQPRFSFQ